MTAPDVAALLALSALPPHGTARLDPDAVPDVLPGARTAGLIDSAPGELLVGVPGLARFHARTDGPVTVAPAAGVTDADVACLLAGPVRAAHLLLHGVFALRATAVLVHGGVVAVAGQTAVGKSVLGAALAQRGHPVLADGVLPVEPTAHGVLAWPTADRIALWPPAARRLGLDPAAGEPVRPALAKRSHLLSPLHPAPIIGAALPLRAVVSLDLDRTVPAPVLTEVTGGPARLRTALAHVWHPHLVEPLDLGPTHFTVGTTLAGTVPLLRVSRPGDGFSASSLADLVEAAVT